MHSMIRKQEPAYNQAYEIIRDRIIRGDLRPGTKLVEEKLAEELGVSRTPVRESIRRLEQEGLVQGKTVGAPTNDDLRDIYGVRIQLEGYAAKRAAAVLSQEKIGYLWDNIKTARTGTIDEVIQANTAFHDTIVEASENRYMIDIIDRMRSLILLFRHKIVFSNRPFLIDEHEQIYEAIHIGNGDDAESLMKQHLQNDLEFHLESYKSMEKDL